MNWGAFASGLEGLGQVTVSSLAAAGVIGAGSTPTTHATTQVPAAGVAAANASPSLFGTSGSGWNWLLIAGLVLAAIVVVVMLTKKRR